MKRVFPFIFLFCFSCSNEKEQYTYEIPFKYERNIYILAKINGEFPGNFMFDTGAYNLYLDSLYNKRSGINFENLSMPCELCMVCQSVYYKPGQTWIINPKATFGKQCDGIVGWDMFDEKVVKIDYVNEKLTVAEPGEIEIDTSYRKIPIARKGNWFVVDLEVRLSKNLKVKGPFIFDTGFGGCVNFSGSTTRKYRLDTLNCEKVKYVSDWRVVNSLRSYVAVVRGRSVKLGDLSVAEPTLEYYSDTTGILGNTEYLGLLGNRFFDHFDVILDLQAKELYMRPNEYNKRFMKMRDLGLGFVDRTDICDGFIVGSFSEGSKAAKSGVKVGDIITHFNDVPVKNNSERMALDLYKNLGTETTFTFKRGDSTFKLSLVMEEKLKKRGS